MTQTGSRAIARQLIASAEAKKIPVTNLKIQKLLYFSHGLSLVWKNEKLLEEDFQAWKYGPVLPSLYHDLKIFGQSPLKISSGFIRSWPEIKIQEQKSKVEEIINLVLDQLGGHTGPQLVEISHNNQGPWHAVYNSEKKDIKITNAAIKKYFETIVRIPGGSV
jgi:uncharacterized phage-associated protein